MCSFMSRFYNMQTASRVKYYNNYVFVMLTNDHGGFHFSQI